MRSRGAPVSYSTRRITRCFLARLAALELVRPRRHEGTVGPLGFLANLRHVASHFRAAAKDGRVTTE